MNLTATGHWQTVYGSKDATGVSWYAPHLEVSLALIERAGVRPAARIIDVGAGASTLIDDLLERGFDHITALDVSAAALETTRRRLGDRRSARIDWRVGDVLETPLAPGEYDLWHDRAALHFLTAEADVARYVQAAGAALAVGGHAIVGCFAADGPERCSGLPVTRRDPDALAALFGGAFTPLETRRSLHTTPWGSTQSFAYALLRKIA